MKPFLELLLKHLKTACLEQDGIDGISILDEAIYAKNNDLMSYLFDFES